MCYNDRAAGVHRATFGHFLTHRLHHFLSSYCIYVIQYSRPLFSSGKFHSVYEHVWNQHIFEKTRHRVHDWSSVLCSLLFLHSIQYFVICNTLLSSREVYRLWQVMMISLCCHLNDFILGMVKWDSHLENVLLVKFFKDVDCCIMDIAGSNDFWKKLGTNIFKVP